MIGLFVRLLDSKKLLIILAGLGLRNRDYVYRFLSHRLTETLARFGYEHNLLVLVEGFYETDIYGDMLARLRDLFGSQTLAYYYDLSFEETVRRHQTRAKQEEFSPDDMRCWWKGKDFLGWESSFFKDSHSLETAFERIIQDLHNIEKG